MRICVDIQAAVAQRAGVGRYTRNLVEHLGAEAPSDSDELRLFYFDFHRRGLDFTCPHARLVPVRWMPGKYVQHSWIHDTARRADAIITDSHFSKREIEGWLKVPPDKVFAIHLGVSPTCSRPAPSSIDSLRDQLNLARPYLLTVGTLEPRKNLPFMVDVFEAMTDFDGDLVIAGMPGWKVEPILARMHNSPKRDRIRYLEYIPDGQLSSLYAGAELFLITSFYEGFGFPPLEAMACGTPVVSSPGGSLAEVLGDAAIVVPEFDATLWANALHSLLHDRTRRDRLAAQAPAHAARFSWAETAKNTWDVYRKVMA